MAQCITGFKLPAIQDLYTRRCQRKALKMDCSLCRTEAVPETRSKRLLISFYPQAIRLLNSQSNGYLDHLH
jgi:hypothetical protein